MRTNLVEALAMGWRYAENIYQEYDEDIMKIALKDIQDNCNLTEKEIVELEDICSSMGV